MVNDWPYNHRNQAGCSNGKMDSFNIHGRVIADYRGYIESFIQIKDEEIRVVVDQAVLAAYGWQQPSDAGPPTVKTPVREAAMQLMRLQESGAS